MSRDSSYLLIGLIIIFAISCSKNRKGITFKKGDTEETVIHLDDYNQPDKVEHDLGITVQLYTFSSFTEKFDRYNSNLKVRVDYPISKDSLIVNFDEVRLWFDHREMTRKDIKLETRSIFSYKGIDIYSFEFSTPAGLDNLRIDRYGNRVPAAVKIYLGEMLFWGDTPLVYDTVYAFEKRTALYKSDN